MRDGSSANPDAALCRGFDLAADLITDCLIDVVEVVDEDDVIALADLADDVFDSDRRESLRDAGGCVAGEARFGVQIALRDERDANLSPALPENSNAVFLPDVSDLRTGPPIQEMTLSQRSWGRLMVAP